MTQDEFAKRMREIADHAIGLDDPDPAHRDCDELVIELLEQLGYSEAVAPYKTIRAQKYPC